MRAAVIEELGGEPVIREMPEPEPKDGQILVKVTTAALNPHDLVYAAGIRLKPPLPHVPGVECVGRLPDDSRVYVPSSKPPHGTFAEYCITDEVIPIPEGVTDAQALGVGAAGTTAWLALTWKGAFQPGESVLVMGATGAVGQVAVQAAAALGAKRVVAAGRDRDVLAQLRDRGATDTVVLEGDYDSALVAAAQGGFDLVIDSLFGEPLMAAIRATRPGGRIVNLGMRAGRTMELHGVPLKGKDLLSCSVSEAPPTAVLDAFGSLIDLVQEGQMETRYAAAPLEDALDVWRRQSTSPHMKLLLTI